jgi:hypothetical protein
LPAGQLAAVHLGVDAVARAGRERLEESAGRPVLVLELPAPLDRGFEEVVSARVDLDLAAELDGLEAALPAGGLEPDCADDLGRPSRDELGGDNVRQRVPQCRFVGVQRV